MQTYQFQQSVKYPNPKPFELLEYYEVVTPSDLEYVYTPGDDSYLMLSILNEEINNDRIPEYETILEIGSGSGILLSHLYHWLRQKNNTPTLAFSTDINFEACLVSTKYYQKYDIQINSICTSMMDHLRIKPNIIVFNPPYIPSDSEEELKEKQRYNLKLQELKQGIVQRSFDNNMIAYSWMGGQDGLDTVWRLLQIVSWKSTIYLVVIHQNPIQKLKEIAEAKGFSFEVLGYKHKYNEKIFIVKLTHS